MVGEGIADDLCYRTGFARPGSYLSGPDYSITRTAVQNRDTHQALSWTCRISSAHPDPVAGQIERLPGAISGQH